MGSEHDFYGGYMSDIKAGDLVILIGCDNFMPPLGASGEVVRGVDSYMDCEVLFPNYPCPVCEITWEIPINWLMKINPLSDLEDVTTHRQDLIPNEQEEV